VQQLCASADKEVCLLVRNLDLRHFGVVSRVANHASVTLVTANSQGEVDEKSYQFVLDFAKILARDRLGSFRLFVNPNFDGRWLRCDDAMYKFGDAIRTRGHGIAFTIAEIDGSVANRQVFDSAITGGTELSLRIAE
jgi:hypothetical protein